MDAVVEFGLAAISGVEEDTPAMGVKICNPMEAVLHQCAFCERIPKCSVAYLRLSAQVFGELGQLW